MKQLTTKKFDIQLILGSFATTIFFGGFIAGIVLMALTNDGAFKDRRVKNGAGYYCEYCHQGVESKKGLYKSLYDKEATIFILQNHECKRSDSGKHSIKWFSQAPIKLDLSKNNKRKEYIE